MIRPHEAQNQNPDAKDRILVALDVATAAEAREIVAELSGKVGGFKIGLQLFSSAGPDIIREFTAFVFRGLIPDPDDQRLVELNQRRVGYCLQVTEDSLIVGACSRSEIEKRRMTAICFGADAATSAEMRAHSAKKSNEPSALSSDRSACLSCGGNNVCDHACRKKF